MGKGRLEAFSDGVIAIIITIMVLELRAPAGDDASALVPLIPKLGGYVLSFVYVGIYWANHHHLLHAIGRVSGGILWANLHLLFWLSLVPFATAWMGEHDFAAFPTALYGVVLLMAALSWTILLRLLIAHHGPDSTLAAAVGNRVKETISTVSYIAAIPLAFVHPAIACGLYAFVAILWLVPDRRIERRLQH